MEYVAFLFALTLACVAGMEFVYFGLWRRSIVSTSDASPSLNAATPNSKEKSEESRPRLSHTRRTKKRAGIVRRRFRKLKQTVRAWSNLSGKQSLIIQPLPRPSGLDESHQQKKEPRTNR